MAHCDRNDGSRQNGIVAHLHRTGGSFGRRLFNLRPGGLPALLFRSINGVMFLIERKSNFDKMVGEF